MEKIFESILCNHLSLGIISFDLEYKVKLVNEWFQKHSGLKANNICSKNILDVFPEIWKRGKDNYLKNCLCLEQSFILSPVIHEYFIDLKIVKQGISIQMIQETKIFPIIVNDKIEGGLIIIKDHTEQMQNEQELYEKNRMLNAIRKVNQLMIRETSEKELILNAVKIIVQDTDASHACFSRVPKDSQTSGKNKLSFDIFEGDTFEGDGFNELDEIIHDNPRFSFDLDLIQKVIQTGELQVSNRQIDAQSVFTEYWDFFEQFQFNAVIVLPIKYEGRVIGVLQIFKQDIQKIKIDDTSLFQELANDISFALSGIRNNEKRIKAEKKLAAEKERLFVTLKGIGDAVLVCNAKGQIELMNSVAENLTGWKEENAQGKPVSEVFHVINEFTRKPCENPVEKVLKTGKTIHLANHTKLIAKDEKEYVIVDSGAPIMDSDGRVSGVVLVFCDVTKKVQMEAEMIKIQKMQTIGVLAGGIAHDFNNILFPIVGYAEMLLDDIPNDNPLRGDVNEIMVSALRAKDLVNQILTFSREEKGELKLMKLQPIINEALKLIRCTIPATISINKEIQPDCGVIKADPTKIHQVVMNIATNAYHAMEDTGGELTVKLKEIEIGKSQLINLEMTPGLFACLTIADQGIGMDIDLKNKIFDPFFTTKEKGKGTGMGLSVVHGIVTGLHGCIQIFSEPGEGTEFRIYFPIEKTYQEQKNKTKQLIPLGTEHILLVDDEEGIINMERQMLEHMGYQVTPYTNSLEALEAFGNNSEKFDVIITDLAMPNMAGDKLASEMLKMRPNIPIILNTGFSDKMTLEVAEKIGIKGVLMKPMVKSELSQTIREVLDKEPLAEIEKIYNF